LTPIQLQAVTLEDLDSSELNHAVHTDITLPMEAVSTTDLSASRRQQANPFQTGSFQAVEAPAELKTSAYRQLISALILIAPIVLLLALYFPVEQQREELLAREKVLYDALEWAANRSV
jgi:hypothetical protein